MLWAYPGRGVWPPEGKGSDGQSDDRIEDVNKHCLEEFRAHWQCLDNNNHQLWQCRAKEWRLNKCVFSNLVCTSPSSGSRA